MKTFTLPIKFQLHLVLLFCIAIFCPTKSNGQNISNVQQISVTSTQVDIGFTVNPNNALTTVRIQYSLQNNNFGAGVQTATFPTNFTGNTPISQNLLITGLFPDKVYYYRVFGENVNGSSYFPSSGYYNFITLLTDPILVPTVNNVAVSGVTLNSANVTYSLKANNGATTSTLKYGLTSGNLTNSATGTSATGNAVVASAATATGLALNTQYFYRVVATNSAGTTQSAEGNFTTLPPVAITNVSSTPTQIPIGVGINYTLTSNTTTATTSIIKYGLSSSNLSQQIAGFSATGTNASTNNISVAGLLPNTQYFYQIEATNALGTNKSSVLSFTTPAALITFDSVTATAVGQTTATVAVDLGNVCVGSQYKLQYASGNNSVYVNPITATFSTNNTAGTKLHDLTGLIPNTNYKFIFVSDANMACNNAYVESVIGTFRTSGPVVAPAITSVTSSGVTSSGATINYTLNANNAATTSVIKFGVTSGNLSEQIPGFVASGNLNASGTAQIAGLLSGKQYFYRVDATNSAGTTIGTVQNFTTTSLPLTLTNVGASLITTSSATVSVSVNNLCAGGKYKVYYSTVPNFLTFEEITYTAPAGGNSGIINNVLTGLIANRTYYFYFYTAINQACNPGAVGSGTLTFTTTAPLPVISNVSSVVNGNAATVNYNVNTGGHPTTTVVKYGLSSGALNNQVTGAAATASIIGLNPSTQYFYRVQSTNQFGTVQSAILNFITGLVPPLPIAFSNLTASAITPTSATVSVDLSNVCPDALYVLQYSISNTFGSFVQQVPLSTGGTGGTKDYAITGLSPNTTYYFRFYSNPNTACNPTQVLSATANFKTLVLPPIAFSNLASSAITATTATLSVDLSDVCSLTAAYRLQYAENATFSGPTLRDVLQATGGTNGTKNHNISSLTANKVHYFRFYSAANTACNPTPVYSATGSFRTPGTVGLPIISANSATPGINSAVIKYTIDTNNAATTTIVKYGESATVFTDQVTGFSVGSGSIISGSVNLPNLQTNTLYYYSIEATNGAGVATTTTASFTTGLVISIPTISAISVSNSNTINYTLNSNNAATTSVVKYGLSSTLSDQVSVTGFSVAAGSTISGNAVISGLLSNTIYYYRVEATNSAGTTLSSIASFKTSIFVDLNVTNITQNSATVNVNVLNTCSNGTYNFQYSENSAFSPLSGSSSFITSVPGVNSVNLTGLTPNKLYYYRFYVESFSACTNAAIYSENGSFTTGPIVAPVTPIFTQVSAICVGQTLAALPTTSTNGITGTWSPATMNTTATTTYTFTPAANQNSTTTTMMVVVNPLITPLFTALEPLCAGATVSPLPTTSLDGITGMWSPAFNNATTTTYTFTPDAGQCAATKTMLVTIRPNAVPTFNAVAPICAGTPMSILPTMSNNGVSGTWSPALDNTTTTTYTFTSNSTLYPCASPVTLTIVVNPKVTPTFTQVGPVCSGNTFTLPTTSNNGITGTWSPALTFISTRTYTFIPTSGECANTTTMTVSVNSGATPTFTQIAPICSGTAFTLPTTSNNSIPGTWLPAVNNTATTTYTFTPSGTQCGSTATMTVIVNPAVTPTFTQIVSLCSGTAFTLPTSSNNNITGTWLPTVNNTATTTYTFTPTAGQCASTTTMTVTINSSATPTFTQVAPICSGTAFTLPVTSNNNITGTWSPILNNTATTTYTFTPTAGQCATTATMTVTVNPKVTPVFTQVAPVCSSATLAEVIALLPTTSTNGIVGTWSQVFTGMFFFSFNPTTEQCYNAVTMTIEVNPIVTPTFIQVSAICIGGTLNALPLTSSNNITGTWLPALNNTATTTYTFTPTAGQCANVTSMTIAVNSSTTPTFTQITPKCSGTAFTLPGTSNNTITGTWTPAVNNTATTTYTFTPNAGQCATTATMTVVITPNVTPTFTQITPKCAGTAFTLPTSSNNNITGTWLPTVNNSATTTYTFTPTAGQCATSATMTVVITPNVTPAFTQVSAICVGGTLNALPLTSSNNITGTWLPALNNTATTTYTFTPNAGQCANTTTMTIAVNSSTTPTFTQVSAICVGGTLSALPLTSSNNISGTWLPALNNTATTTYTFTPNVGQCANTTTMTIAVNSSTTPTFTQITPKCSGIAFTLPTSSNNSITGTWTPAVNNTSTTTYTFSPTAGQCATTTTMTVVITPNVTPTFTQITPKCAGTAFTLPTSSNNSITGTWSPVVSYTATTTYTFTPTTGQCASTATMTVVVNSADTPIASANQTFVEGATIASLIATPSTVIWYATNADAISGNNPLASTTLLATGTYYVVNVVGGCRSSVVAVTVSITLGTENISKISWIVYPNPVIDVLNIEMNTEIQSLEIYNVQGQKILHATQKHINLSHLASGMYIIRIQDSQNAIATKKFMKK